MSLTKVSFSMIGGAYVNVLDYGAAGDGVTDNTAAITAAVAALPNGGTVFFPPGTYLVSANATFTGMQSITWEGAGQYASKIKIPSDNLIFKSPNKVTFSRLHFLANDLNSVQQSVWVSNYTDVSFVECYFSGFGGGSGNKAGSTCLYMHAGDTDATTTAAGSSANGLLQNCVFWGNSRLTNFGVRIYTETNAATAENIGTKVEGCSFSAFNWNAVEINGPRTRSVTVSNCIAYVCGLVPFDIDKGANNCTIQNVVIERLLGNIDTVANPNTAVACVSTSGVDATTGYAYNNLVQGVVARLLASDLASYNGRGVCAVGIAYAKNCTIRDVRMYIDSIPARPSSASFALAQVRFATCANVTVENIETTNASVGIYEAETFNSAIGSGPVRFKNFTNAGTMKGEVISAPNSTWSGNQYSFSDIYATTDMSDPIDAAKNSCVVFDNPNVGVGSAGFYAIRRASISCSNASSYGIYPGAFRTSLNNVGIGLNTSANFFASGGAMARFFATDLFCAASATDVLDVSVGFANISATCVVYSSASSDMAPLIQGFGGGRLFSSAVPTNPPNAYWSQPCTLEKLTGTSGGYIGWTQTVAGWKQYGAIL